MNKQDWWLVDSERISCRRKIVGGGRFPRGTYLDLLIEPTPFDRVEQGRVPRSDDDPRDSCAVGDHSELIGRFDGGLKELEGVVRVRCRYKLVKRTDAYFKKRNRFAGIPITRLDVDGQVTFVVSREVGEPLLRLECD